MPRESLQGRRKVDPESLENIVSNVLKTVVRMNRQRVYQDIEDALSDAIVVYFRKASEEVKNDPKMTAGFLYNATNNFLKNQRKKHSRYSTFNQNNGAEFDTPSDENIEKSTTENDLLQFLFAHLTPYVRSIVIENENGKTLSEIAQQLGKSLKSVEKAHERAMKKLRKVWILEREKK